MRVVGLIVSMVGIDVTAWVIQTPGDQTWQAILGGTLFAVGMNIFKDAD